MGANRHIIKRLILELTLSNKNNAWKVQNRLSKIFYSYLNNLIESFCDTYSPKETIWVIDKLEIDLGKLKRSNLEKELVEKTSSRLTSVLSENHDRCSKNFSYDEKKHIKSKWLTQQQKALTLFDYFIKTGALPWWGKNEEFNLEKCLGELIKNVPNDLKARINNHIKIKNSLQRIILHCSDTTLAKLSQLYAANQSKFINQYYSEVSQVLNSIESLRYLNARRLRVEHWSAILSNMAYYPRKYPEHLKFLEKVFTDLAMYRNLTYQGLLNNILTAYERLQPLKSNPQSKFFKLIQKLYQKSPKNDENKSIEGLLQQLTDRLNEGSLKESALHLLHIIKRKEFGKLKSTVSVFEKLLSDFLKENDIKRRKYAEKIPLAILRELEKILKKALSFPISDNCKLKINGFLKKKRNTKAILRYDLKILIKNLYQALSNENVQSHQKNLKAILLQLDIILNDLAKSTTFDLPKYILKDKKSLSTAAVNDYANGAMTKRIIPLLVGALDKLKEKDSIKEKSNITQLQSKEEIYINNAGLVLLWVFFVRYFKALELIEDKKFKSLEAAKHAVLLLQYWVYPQENFSEHELILNKILCCIPQSEPLDTILDITESEQKESNSLLVQVLEQWPDMNRMGINYFKEYFLKRSGMIREHSNHWQLCVEHSSHDLLIHKKPWSIQVIKLPWMDKPLLVEW